MIASGFFSRKNNMFKTKQKIFHQCPLIQNSDIVSSPCTPSPLVLVLFSASQTKPYPPLINDKLKLMENMFFVNVLLELELLSSLNPALPSSWGTGFISCLCMWDLCLQFKRFDKICRALKTEAVKYYSLI